MYHIVTAPGCKYCENAKDLLSGEGLDYTTYDLTEAKFLLTLFQKVGYKTVPQIWLDKEYIGGYTELENKLWKEAEDEPTT